MSFMVARRPTANRWHSTNRAYTPQASVLSRLFHVVGLLAFVLLTWGGVAGAPAPALQDTPQPTPRPTPAPTPTPSATPPLEDQLRATDERIRLLTKQTELMTVEKNYKQAEMGNSAEAAALAERTDLLNKKKDELTAQKGLIQAFFPNATPKGQ